MNDLDDPSLYPTLDPTGLRVRLRGLPGQCELAWQQARSSQLGVVKRQWNKVVIGGMGGSAIAGDLVVGLASQQRTAPILVVRDFHLPFALDEHTLVIVCSYSGNTEETLSMFHEALRTEAQTVVVTGGGILAQEAMAQKIPLFTIGLPGEPRNVVCYSLMLLLGMLQSFDLLDTQEAEVNSAIRILRHQVLQLSEDIPTSANLAKQLAMRLQGKMIVICGGGIFLGLAVRWKAQFNENAKTWAFSESIPELLHNTIEAYPALPGIGKFVTALLLQPSTGTESLMRRYPVVSELLSRWSIDHAILQGVDGSPLAQLLGMLALGDYVSYYLALLNGVDPSPTPIIASAKERVSHLQQSY